MAKYFNTLVIEIFVCLTALTNLNNIFNENEKEGRGEKSSISDMIISGMRWKMISSIVIFFIQFGTGIVLARILAPQDFGILVMAMVLIEFAKTGTGLGIEFPLMKRENLTDDFIRSCFTLAALTGIFGTAILVSVAPAAKFIFDEALVVPVLRVLSLTFFFSSIHLVSRGLLRREFELKKLMITEIVSYLAGYLLFAIPMAAMGYGVWSLVAGILVAEFMMMIMQYSMTRHPLKFRFNRAELRNIFSFGGGVSLTNFFNFIAQQGDYLIVGVFFNTHILGLYSRAYKLMNLPMRFFTSTIYRVLGPAYARIRKKEGRVRFMYLAAVNVATIVTLPIMAIILIYGEEIIVGFYGQRWIGVAPILRIFVLFGVLRNIRGIGGSIARMSGNVYYELKISIVYSMFVMVGAVIGSRWGIYGVAWGVGTAIIIDYLLMSGLCNRITDTRVSEYIRAHFSGVKISIVVTLGNLLLKYYGFPNIDSVLVKVLFVLVLNASGAFIVVYAFPRLFINDIVEILRDHVHSDSKYFKLIPKLKEDG